MVRIRERVTYIRKMHKTIHYNAQFEVFKTMLPNIPPTSVQQTLLFFLVFVKLTSSPETSFCHLSQPLQTNIGVARGGPKGPCPPKFLETIVILCFERRFSKQNIVIRLQSHILAPDKFLGWLRHCKLT